MVIIPGVFYDMESLYMYVLPADWIVLNVPFGILSLITPALLGQVCFDLIIYFPYSLQAGQAYFISDENPLKTFEFLRPLFYGFGKTLPSVKIPSSVVYFVAFLLEFIHWILKPIIVLEPLLTRNEVSYHSHAVNLTMIFWLPNSVLVYR